MRLLVLSFLAVAAFCDGSPALADGKHGKSGHGSAFDSGLRSRPWEMKGIGSAPFPITTLNPEVQRWYNEGNALLQSFWFEEAERSFRWCHKLEPENAMVYFGLARCGLNWFNLNSPAEGTQRYRDFLAEAVKRKASVTERERLFIEAWEAVFLAKPEKPQEVMVRKLEELCLKFPEDLEAKVLLGFANIGLSGAAATDSLLREILKVAPNHPGVHHARIHNWDGVSPAQAINSCDTYARVAPGTGHARHMPGHIFSKIGMWHEAAIAMDSSTRLELKYMNQRLAFPWETWNYAHNRDYLCYIQEQLGRAEASIQGARDLINAPIDPELDPGNDYWSMGSLMRALVKFERWDELLELPTATATFDPYVLAVQNSLQSIALAKTGRVKEAEEKMVLLKKGLEQVKKMMAAAAPDDAAFEPGIFRAAEAFVRLAQGNREEGLKILRSAAEAERKDREARRYPNDPPIDPWPALRLLGDALAEGGDHRGAIRAYKEALTQEPNDAWCLAGLAKSYAALGQPGVAKEYASRFLAVWSHADKGLRVMEEVLALNLGAKPKAVTPRPERIYDPAKLDALGPSNWAPFAAPTFSAMGADEKPIRLQDFKGKNVLLVFYLSDQCVHCVEQLAEINKNFDKFTALDTVVLAVSSDSPEKNRSNALASFKLTLVSDTHHDNARRFASYDDFESMELHSTILIDRDGRVRWKRTGGDPFMKIGYLLGEIKRWGTTSH